MTTPVPGQGDGHERRRFYRVRCDMKVLCRLSGPQGQVVSGRSGDVSRGGVRLHVKEDLPLGRVAHMTFTNDTFKLRFEMAGEVVWKEWQEKTQGYEIGIRFQRLSVEDEKRVLSLIGRLQTDAKEDEKGFFRLRRYAPVRISGVGDRSRGAIGLAYELGLDGMTVEVSRDYSPGTVCMADIYLATDSDPATVTARIEDVCQQPEGQLWVARLHFESFDLGAREMIGRLLEDELRLALQPHA